MWRFGILAKEWMIAFDFCRWFGGKRKWSKVLAMCYASLFVWRFFINANFRREIMKDIQISEWMTYVPAWMGNRDEEDPITVDLRPMTMKESERYAGMIVTTQRPGFRGQTQDNAVAVAKKQFMTCCQNIRGLSVNGQTITEPKELWETPLTDLVNELTTAINSVSVLQEGDVKNFVSPSAGSKKASAGTAKAV